MTPKKYNVFLANPEEDKSKLTNINYKNQFKYYSHPLATESTNSILQKIMVGIEFIEMLVLSYIYKFFKRRLVFNLVRRKSREKIFALINSDIVIYRSIDQFTNIYGLHNFIKYYLQAILIYNLSGKRFILHSITCYINDSNFGDYLLKDLASKVSLSVRDTYSAKSFSK